MTTTMSLTHFLNYYRTPPHLHPFPTRRSSDLVWQCKNDATNLFLQRTLRKLTPSRKLLREGEPQRSSFLLGVSFRSALWRKRLRSEEHTSELQSLTNLVCRLLLEKKKITCTML